MWGQVYGTPYGGDSGSQYTQNVSANLSFSGQVTKLTKRSLLATLSFTGQLLTFMQSLIIQALNATLTMSGQVSRSIYRSLATAVLAFSGALSKSIPLDATLSFVGATNRRTAALLTGALSFTDQMLRIIGVRIGGQLSFAGTYVWSLIRTLLAGLTLGGTISRFTRLHSWQGALSFVGRRSLQAQRAFRGTLQLSASLTHLASKSFSAALHMGGHIARAVPLHSALTFTGQTTKRLTVKLVGILSSLGAFRSLYHATGRGIFQVRRFGETVFRFKFKTTDGDG